MCVFGLKVELYKASTYCRQCLTQKMQSNCNRRGGCIILKISPCHWSAPAVKTALEPTITFWPRRSSGWNVSSFADILHWRRRLWSARHPPLMIRCENCVCSTVCKECQSLSTVTGDKSQTIANYWAQLLHSSSSWSASLTPPVLLVEASKQKMIGQIPDSRNCTKPFPFVLSVFFLNIQVEKGEWLHFWKFACLWKMCRKRNILMYNLIAFHLCWQFFGQILFPDY